MIDLLLAMLAEAAAPYEPPPEPWYHQAVACGASALAAKGKDPTGDEVGEMMTWGLIMAEAGRKAGRSRAQVDSGDLEAALPFYRRIKDRKPAAFAAHRAYCKAMLDADRP
ncbi:MAG TPA: hypothetical protein VFZ91_01930 [Allosphingosinicella sp.]